MDTTSKAIEDALKKLWAAKNTQGSAPGQPTNPQEPEDPRLRKPEQEDNKDNDDDSSGSGSEDFDDDDFDDDDFDTSPQIGDEGDEATQAAEEAERQANAYKEDANQSGDAAQEIQNAAEAAGDAETANNAAKAKEQADKLKKDAQKTAEEAKDLQKDDSNGKSDENKTYSDEKVERARLERIQQKLHDLETQRKALDETEKAVFKSRDLAAERQRRLNHKDNPMARLIDSVKCFVRDQIAYLRGPSWKRFSKRSVEDAPLILKGKARSYNKKIPLINIYFDQSASWGSDDIKAGWQVINALDVYEKRELIKIKVFYFANHVYDNPQAARREGGTSATQEILDHIEQSHCDNVIIMTDGDMDRQGAFTRKVTVDGAVWFVFRESVCTKLTAYLKGKALTKQYLLN